MWTSPGDIIEAREAVGGTRETGNPDGIRLHCEVGQADENGRCSIQDPSSAILAGQNSLCDWHGLDEGE